MLKNARLEDFIVLRKWILNLEWISCLIFFRNIIFVEIGAKAQIPKKETGGWKGRRYLMGIK